MTQTRVTLTHPDIPGSEFSVLPFQVDLYKARGWKTADEAPAKKHPAKTPPPAAAPSTTPKEH